MELPEADSVYRGDLDRLIRKVREERGLDLHQYRRAYAERRLAARMRTLTLHTYRQYERYLDAHPDEYSKLLDTLTINVTDFYRDGSVYEILRGNVIPSLLKEKARARQRSIRVWSAGCATGEEAYSVTMAFLSAMGRDADDFLLNVFATDIDPRALETAREATYDVAKLPHIPKAEQMRFVEKSKDTFRIKPEVTQHVRFKRLNLFEDEPINIVDVILCRNVFIYFTREQQARVLESFWRVLYRGGYLVLGRSEKMAPALAARFELVSGRERVYRKPYNGGTRRS
ncbi:MAG TPA: protein-glutamate O-methyltransferase CheR [Coriobacteriia bacterium]